jgi:hypothetical protein
MLTIENLVCVNKKFHKDCYWSRTGQQFNDSFLSNLISRLKREVLHTALARRVSHDRLGIVSVIKLGHDGELFVESDDSVIKQLLPTRLHDIRSTRPQYRSDRQGRNEFLVDSGFLPFEARAYSSEYSMTQLRDDKTLQNMIRWRRLYVGNAKKKGWGNARVEKAILALYQRNTWYKDGAKYDPMKQVARFRQ